MENQHKKVFSLLRTTPDFKIHCPRDCSCHADGKIVAEGDATLAQKIEQEGFEASMT